MLVSERTFKIKSGSRWIVLEILLGQQLFTFKEFCMEKRLSSIFKTTNVTKSIKAILKSSYIVLQVTSKWKTLKQPVCFVRAVEFWPTFDIQISIILAIFWKKLPNYTFQKPHRSFLKHSNIHIDRATHYEVTAL